MVNPNGYCGADVYRSRMSSSVSLSSQDSAKSTVVRSAVSVNEFATHPPIVEISVLTLTRPFCRESEPGTDRDNSGGVGGRT